MLSWHFGIFFFFFHQKSEFLALKNVFYIFANVSPQAIQCNQPVFKFLSLNNVISGLPFRSMRFLKISLGSCFSEQPLFSFSTKTNLSSNPHELLAFIYTRLVSEFDRCCDQDLRPLCCSSDLAVPDPYIYRLLQDPRSKINLEQLLCLFTALKHGEVTTRHKKVAGQ